MSKIQIISVIASLLFLLAIFQLTRRKKIRSQYSLVWFGCGLVLLFFSIFKGLIDLLARLLGIFYAPSLILIILVFLGLVLGIHFSIVTSKISEDNRKLIQEIALLKNRIEQMEKRENRNPA